MKWLKYKHSYAHGHSAPDYIALGDTPSVDSIEEAKYEVRNSPDADRDGFRAPVFEIVDSVPDDVLDKMIDQTKSMIRSHTEWLVILNAEWRKNHGC